jgi:sporulation protein YlmC with PRC-barrel domain
MVIKKIFARNLRDKQFVSSDGVTLGVLNNIVIDIRENSHLKGAFLIL